MNLHSFIRILRNADGKLDTLEKEGLERLVEKYPYFQAARALLLKSLDDGQSPDYPGALAVTASRTSDREVLYDFVQEHTFVQNTLANSLERTFTVAQETVRRTDSGLFDLNNEQEESPSFSPDYPIKTEDPDLFVPLSVSGMMGLSGLHEEEAMEAAEEQEGDFYHDPPEIIPPEAQVTGIPDWEEDSNANDPDHLDSGVPYEGPDTAPEDLHSERSTTDLPPDEVFGPSGFGGKDETWESGVPQRADQPEDTIQPPQLREESTPESVEVQEERRFRDETSPDSEETSTVADSASGIRGSDDELDVDENSGAEGREQADTIYEPLTSEDVITNLEPDVTGTDTERPESGHGQDSPVGESLWDQLDETSELGEAEAEQEILTGIPIQLGGEGDLGSKDQLQDGGEDLEHEEPDVHTFGTDETEPDTYQMGDWIRTDQQGEPTLSLSGAVDEARDMEDQEPDSDHSIEVPVISSFDSEQSEPWMEDLMEQLQDPLGEEESPAESEPEVAEYSGNSSRPGPDQGDTEPQDQERDEAAVRLLLEDIRSAFSRPDTAREVVQREQSYTEPSEEAHPTSDTSAAEEPSAAEILSEREATSAPPNQEPSIPSEGKRSFLQWLEKTAQSDRGSGTSRDESGTPRMDEEKARKFALVDQFIKNSPKLGVNLEGQGSQPGATSPAAPSEEEHSLFTETLARLHREQGNYARALRAYEALKLKYPEKSSYFAGLIQEIKDIQSKNLS